MLYKLSTTIVSVIFRLFFALKVEGLEEVPRTVPFILASNHLSNIDPPLLAAACPVAIGFLAKQELLKNKFLAFYYRAVGVVPLDRGKSDIRAIRLSLEMLKTRTLLVFPQGTRGSENQSFKDGVGFLQKKSQVPVVAAKIYGSDKVLPKGAKFFKSGRLLVRFSLVNNLQATDSRETVTAKVIKRISEL